jgi:phasin
MANDTFMKPEMPESMRDLMKMSIEQAKRAFDTFAATNEKTWKSLESSSQSAGAGLRSLNEKIVSITRDTAEANFALALKLAETKDMGKALELQADYARKQMEQFVHQLEEIRDLAAEIIQESNPVRAETAPGSAPKPSAAPSASSGGSTPYPSPSDFAPDRAPAGSSKPRKRV